MKETICGGGKPKQGAERQILKPFFEVEVRLVDQQCVLSPVLAE